MPYNGSGTFSRLYSWIVDAANNVNISSSRTDAEMNGFAAGLTNCVTRDGQSPPSADLPMGGKKLVNLGLATTATDALSQAAGDARYILSSVTALSLSGSITAGTSLNGATLAISSNGTVGGTLTAVGNITATNGLLQTSGANGGVNIAARDGTSGSAVLYNTANIFRIFYGADKWTLDSSGNVTHPGSLTVGGTAAIGGSAMTVNTNLLLQHNGTDGFVRTQSGILNLGAGGSNWLQIGAAGSISQVGTGTVTFNGQTNLGNVTGTPNGTAVNGLGYLGAPSNAQTASYQLVLADMGKSIDFNGTTLTCTIPANGSVAFPVGTVIVITNLNSSNLSIAITTDTLTMSGTTTTGTRTLGQNGEARIRKVGATSWLIGGTALS